MSEINPELRELADKARAYLSSTLYPAVMGGLGVYSLLEHIDNGRPVDVKTVATAVIEHAEAAGWSLAQDANGFWEAIPPPERIWSVEMAPEANGS